MTLETKPSAVHSTVQELQKLIKPAHFSSLFSGLPASLVGTTASQGVYFYLYSLLRKAAVQRRMGPSKLSSEDDLRRAEISVADSLLIATLAGMGNVIITSPIWVIATRMQAYQQHHHQNRNGKEESGEDDKFKSSKTPGMLAVARDVLSEYGLGGFWNGVGASLVMVINPTIQYALYEWLLATRSRMRGLKAEHSKKVHGARPSALEIFMLSAVAKAGATLLTYPLLTVKTRMMTAKKSDQQMQYTSILDAILRIAQHEGVGGYYKGIRTKILQSVLAAALLFMCKEKITDFTRETLISRREKQ